MKSTTWGMTSDPADDWREKANCRDHGDDTFFPVGEGSNRYHQTALVEVDAAKRVCRVCLVQQLCLQEALERGEQWGIWGGLTPVERKNARIRQVMAEQSPPAKQPEASPEPKSRRGRPPQTKCKRQHPLTGANLKLDGKGHKTCKICHAARQAQVRARRREKAVASC